MPLTTNSLGKDKPLLGEGRIAAKEFEMRAGHNGEPSEGRAFLRRNSVCRQVLWSRSLTQRRTFGWKSLGTERKGF